MKVSDWVKNYVISLVFQCNHCKFLGKLLNELKLVFKFLALYRRSTLKHCLIYLQLNCKKSSPNFHTQALEQYGKHNWVIIQCFLIVLVLEVLLQKQESECSWYLESSCTGYKHKVKWLVIHNKKFLKALNCKQDRKSGEERIAHVRCGFLMSCDFFTTSNNCQHVYMGIYKKWYFDCRYSESSGAVILVTM